MQRISHDYVDTKFIVCFLELYNLSNEHIQFQRDGKIGNEILLDLIEKTYQKFLLSHQDYDLWFERQVIECQLSGNHVKVKVPNNKIHRKPLFLAKNEPRKGYRQFFYPIGQTTMSSDKPIPVDLDVIFEYFNLDGPSLLTSKNCPPFVNLYKYEDGKVVNDSSCPGLSDSAKIELAFNKNEYFWILGKVPKIFKCTKFPGQCSRRFKRKENRDRHENVCTVETIISSKQVKFGSKQSQLEQIIAEKLLPACFEKYRQTFLATFDLECVEKQTHEQIGEKTVKLGVQNLVSIAFASNLPNQKPIFYIRESSEPTMAYKMVEKFVLDVFKAQELLVDCLPVEFLNAIKKIEKHLKNQSFGMKKTKSFHHLRFLKKYTQLAVYGFNSSKVIKILHLDYII